MLFVLWLNMRSMEIVPAQDDDVGLIQGLETLPRVALPTAYPVNISDWFKGTPQKPFGSAWSPHDDVEANAHCFASRYLEVEF